MSHDMVRMSHERTVASHESLVGLCSTAVELQTGLFVSHETVVSPSRRTRKTPNLFSCSEPPSEAHPFPFGGQYLVVDVPAEENGEGAAFRQDVAIASALPRTVVETELAPVVGAP